MADLDTLLPGLPEDVGEALRRSTARYRALVEASATDIWLADLQGRLLSDLPRWREVTGQSQAEVLGGGWLEAVHPDDRERAAQEWDDAVHAGRPYEVEYRIRPLRRDGEERTLSVRGVPVCDGDGRPLEYVGLTVDITERRADERSREALARELVAVAERTRRLQRVTAALSGSLRVVDIARTALDEARLGLGADGGGLSLLDETGTRLRYQVLDGYDTDVKARWSDVSLRTRSPGPDVVRTGRPLLLSGPQELLERYPTEEMARFVQASQERAWARLPLATSGRPFGVLALGWQEERRFTQEEEWFLSALATVCAQALERALHYEHERETALRLQRSLLPDRLPDVNGLALAAGYQPGTTGVEVGGDWYDAFLLADGRVVLVLGDVRGKGAPAASVMGQVRNALRAYALLDPDPALVLERLDALLQSGGDPEEIVTVACVVLDPRDGALLHASAGHLPALLRTPEGTVTPLPGAGDLPLGVAAERRTTLRSRLPVGGALLLLSDGLVERRGASLSEGLAALAQALQDAPADPEPLLADLLERLLPGAAEDDVTVLVAVRPDGHAARVPDVRLELVEDLRSASAARALVRATLPAWGLTALQDDVLLVISELVTNAVVHAATGAVLHLRPTATGVRLEVQDAAPEQPLRPRDADDGATHGRGLALVRAVSTRWGVQPVEGGKVVWAELDVEGHDVEGHDVEGHDVEGHDVEGHGGEPGR